MSLLIYKDFRSRLGMRKK